MREIQFQSQNWDSFRLELTSEIGYGCLVVVSISELRFFSFRAHQIIMANAMAIAFQSQNWDSFRLENFHHGLHLIVHIVVSISELRFFSFRGVSGWRILQIVNNSSFQSQNWDSFRLESLPANACPVLLFIVSISELRFFSFRGQNTAKLSDPFFCMGFNLRIEILFV